MEREVANLPPQFCSNCRQQKNRQGGAWIKFNNGRNQRWICKACAEKRPATAAGTRTATAKDSGASNGTAKR